MKTFKFEITITDEDVMGDEFWEQALLRDGVGLIDLRGAIAGSLVDSNLLHNHTKEEVLELVKLKEYKEQ